jgi:23S rRNA pseudouridine2457 synthase
VARLIRLWKPHGVLSQFTDAAGRPTLADHVAVAGVYPAGRLDADSEGLLLLTDDGGLQARIADPRHHMAKTYLAFVETPPDDAGLQALVSGVTLKDGPARALAARRVPAPALPPRDPPPRPRPGRETAWIELRLDEGRNRQVRRMLAAVGAPVLRLVRTRVGSFTLDGLAPGTWAQETLHAPVSPPGRPGPDGPRRPPPRGRRRGSGSSGSPRRPTPSSRTRRGS